MYSSSRYLIQERAFSFILAQPIQFMLGQKCISFITVFLILALICKYYIHTLVYYRPGPQWGVEGAADQTGNHYKCSHQYIYTIHVCISISANVYLQPIKTSVPTKYIYTMYLYFRQCVFVFNHYECAHQYIYNMYFYFRQCVVASSTEYIFAKTFFYSSNTFRFMKRFLVFRVL